MINELFKGCTTSESRYEKIIQLGRTLADFPESGRTEENLVSGCQSVMYLSSKCSDGKIYFNCWSDALISKGLAALLIKAYDGKSFEYVIKEKPLFLEELGILASLTPSRSNGVQALYTKMQQQALAALISSQTQN